MSATRFMTTVSSPKKSKFKKLLFSVVINIGKTVKNKTHIFGFIKLTLNPAINAFSFKLS